MMRKNNNGGKNNNYKNRQGGGGGRRYGNNNGGGHRTGGGNNDGQNLQRQKHHATQMREKYSNMARDAQNNGDRVDVEYYLQHVDHYTRVLTDIAAIEAERFAHQREQQQQHQPANHESTGDLASGASTGEEAATSSANESVADIAENTHQPRMTRHRQPRHEPPADDHNGAKEANSNTSEIPLPDNILPPI